MKMKETDLRFDAYRAFPTRVNVTSNSVRITHIPTGLWASCEEFMSFHKNRTKALELLEAKVDEHYSNL